MITQPFVIYLVRLPDDFAAPPLFPIFYEIHTIPEGITFPPAPSGSLSLAQADDGPVAGLCTLDENDPLGAPEGAVPGVNLFLSHQVDGEWERLPYVDVTFLDCEDASSETESALWSSPLGLAPVPRDRPAEPRPGLRGRQEHRWCDHLVQRVRVGVHGADSNDDDDVDRGRNDVVHGRADHHASCGRGSRA